MHAWPHLILFALSVREPPLPVHKVDVRVAGPLAMFEVWRSVEATTRVDGARQVASSFDLGLPEGAALLDWEILANRERARLSPQTAVEANTALVAALRLRRLALATVASDESARYRIHLVPLLDGERAVLHYRYAAPATCSNGRMVLRVPESFEENPMPAEVTLGFEPLPGGPPLAEVRLDKEAATIRPGTRRMQMRGVAPGRAAWEIVWRYAEDQADLTGQVVAAAAQTVARRTVDGRSRKVSGLDVIAGLCRNDVASEAKRPSRVVLLVDRSRSVGPGGLSEERALARSLIEALPPSVPFDAVLFGRAAEPLFPLFRLPTRAALDALVAAADPNRLENGTDVVAALARARLLLGPGPEESPAWVILVTDGALPASQTFARMQEALAGNGPGNVHVMVLLLRQRGDDEVPASAISEYAKFARRFGGIVRVLAPGSAGETARALVSAMAKGGDGLGLEVESTKMAEVVEPGRGAHLAFSMATRPPRLRVAMRALGQEVSARVAPVLLKPEWIDPLLAKPSAESRGWTGASAGMAVAILPIPPPPKSAADGTVRGRMDPLVLRNALSLAFMPRARACYLSRRVAKAGDAYLRGRLKLELVLERGELHDAVVRSSTLDNPTVETCVRDAAWAIEYPRPEHRDALTVANLNLVFQPHTPEERRPDASPVDRDIELILGPLTFPADYTDLLEDQ